MTTRKSKFLTWRRFVLTLAVLLAGLLAPAYCKSSGTELFIKPSPTFGGTITPASGLHSFELNSTVELKAVPLPGYKFVCWFGDVSSPTSADTTVHLNGPKIIVALFVPNNLDAPPELDSFVHGGGGSGRNGLRPFASDLSTPDWSVSAGGSAAHRMGKSSFPADALPIPEPATFLLLGLGLAVRLRRRICATL
jgi:hypothetical protein